MSVRIVLVAVALLAGCGRRNFNDGHADASASDARIDADLASWALPGWGVRQSVTISLPTGSQLDDFPVLVRLKNGTSDFSRMAPDGHDLRFVDANGTVLAHDLENFEPTGAAIWIKIPSIQPGVDVPLMMYFENPSAPNIAALRDQVWDSSFHGVFHLGATIEDASREHNAVNPNNPVRVIGVAGEARSFNDVNSDRVMLGSTGFPISNQDRTLCAWARPTNLDGQFHFLAGYGNQIGNDGFTLGRAASELQAGAVGDFVSVPNAFSARWDYYCLTYDNTMTARVYLGGALVGSSVHSSWSTTVGMATIGGWFGANYWIGDIDEVRISDVARGPAWIAAEARVVTTDVATFGAIEPP